MSPSGRPSPPDTSVAPSSMPFLMRAWILLNCTSETTGPITPGTDSGESGGATLTLSAVALAIAMAWSFFAFGTNMREGALQDWPELVIICITPPETALVRSASSSTMFGDLPPSSCATRLTVSAAARATAMPARVEPVNDIMSMPGCEDIASPTVGPSPLTRLNTPGGTPASCSTSANSIAFIGATSDGLSTTVQPAASAGATLQTIWLIGQFHGVMSPQTPTGSFTMLVVPCFSSNL